MNMSSGSRTASRLTEEQRIQQGDHYVAEHERRRAAALQAQGRLAGARTAWPKPTRPLNASLRWRPAGSA